MVIAPVRNCYVSMLVRQKWQHCTFTQCQARASREVSQQPQHILIKCFRKNVNQNQELIDSGRHPAQYVAATELYNSLQGTAAAHVRQCFDVMNLSTRISDKHSRVSCTNSQFARMLRLKTYWLGTTTTCRESCFEPATGERWPWLLKISEARLMVM